MIYSHIWGWNGFTENTQTGVGGGMDPQMMGILTYHFRVVDAGRNVSY